MHWVGGGDVRKRDKNPPSIVWIYVYYFVYFFFSSIVPLKSGINVSTLMCKTVIIINKVFLNWIELNWTCGLRQQGVFCRTYSYNYVNDVSTLLVRLQYRPSPSGSPSAGQSIVGIQSITQWQFIFRTVNSWDSVHHPVAVHLQDSQ